MFYLKDKTTKSMEQNFWKNFKVAPEKETAYKNLIGEFEDLPPLETIGNQEIGKPMTILYGKGQTGKSLLSRFIILDFEKREKEQTIMKLY